MQRHRIEYIDALRGFTMLLVVVGHVVYFGYGRITNETFSYTELFRLFRMPLFFFISGFVFYKASRQWDWGSVKKLIIEKARVQLVPTVIFLSLFVIIFRLNPWEAIGVSKAGYWFTIELFEYFLVFSLTTFVVLKVAKEQYLHIVNLAVSLLFVMIGVIIQNSDCYNMYDLSVWTIIDVNKMPYYLYFVLGVIARRYFEYFQSIMDNKWCMTFLIVIFSVSAIVICHPKRFNYWTVWPLIPGVSGVCVIFAYFRKYNYFKFRKLNKIV